MAGSNKVRSFIIRLSTASILIPIVLIALFLGKFFTLILILVVINLCLIEFLRFCHRKNIFPYPACIFLPANLLPVGIYLSSPLQYLSSLLFIYIILLSLLRFGQKSFLERISTTTFIIIYLSLLPSTLILLRKSGVNFALFPIVITWIFDTGAYLVGSGIGRLRLSPDVSPKKTYEGLIGGIVISLPSLLLLNQWFKTNFSLFDSIMITTGIGILATLGDLFESAFKREVGLKDTSQLFPGHGGMLDRIDSLLFTIPFFYLFLKLRGY
ncbi:MAG: phosphatidate cytidylyltransferase [candidate division WOR-3 bacterium]